MTLNKHTAFGLATIFVLALTGCKSKQKLAIEQLNGAMGGEWLIQSVGNTVYNDDTSYPTLCLLADKQTYDAFDGCNHNQGQYRFDEKTGQLLFDAGLSTMMLCPNPLNTGIKYDSPTQVDFKSMDGDDYMYLTDNSSKVKTVLRKMSLKVLNGRWRIAEVDGKTFDNADLTMTFDLNTMRVTGTTDCNSYSGEIVASQDKPMGMTLSNVAVSMRMCPNMTAERTILSTLAKINEVDFKNSGLVYLKGQNATIKLVKVDAKK